MRNYDELVKMIKEKIEEYGSDDVVYGLQMALDIINDKESETSNSYYNKINKRYEERTKQLTEIGYEFKIVEIDGTSLGAFTYKYAKVRSQNRVISSGVVLYSEPRAWSDLLESAKRYAGK